MLVILFCLSVIMALVASAWIDSLYRREREILTFPEKTKAAAFRMPLLIAGVYGLAVYWTGAGWQFWELVRRLLLSWFLLMTMVTDLEQHLIFDRMQLPFALLALPFMLWEGQAADCLLAAIAGGGGFLLLSLITKGSIGGGDIKLIFVLGLWLGTEAVFRIAMGGFILSGAVAMIMLLSKRWQRDERFAYSPYFSVMALCLLLN